ncbi:Lengsin [Bagarius yarrelli]|uniref:Lengsin n=1 Tax=Bagarius yarrelli TaxID=175774 RepID=A0A556V2E9_BAGYA|nr:Lengsin [Bagarius yarrelli]
MESDQIDGGNQSSGKKKGVKKSGKDAASSKWNRGRNDLPKVQTNFSAPSQFDKSTIISIGPHRWPTVITESQPEDHTSPVEENRDVQPDNQPPDAAEQTEKAVYGVPMPRSYLELTLSPKENEVDHPAAQSFNSDILLIPDLSTFRTLPWAEQTARIICDPCTVTGIPLRTSPRLIAKIMLGQLNTMGFSIYSSFTYECCIFRIPERMDPKNIFFPATTLLSNHDMPFLQQMVKGLYHIGINVDSFASASGPGQMEICFKPKFGIEAADNAFTFRTGVKEMARTHNYIATFLTDDIIHNSVCLAHSLWDADGRDNLFHSGAGEMSEVGKKWLGGLLQHSPALSCLMAPGLGCRTHLCKDNKSTFFATCGSNDNSCTFNVKFHGGQNTQIENRLGSAIANPYIVMAATIAAGLDGIRSNLCAESRLNRPTVQQKDFAISVKLEDALMALEEDHVICRALGEPFVRYFIAIKRLEIETQMSDTDRNKNLEYFI